MKAVNERIQAIRLLEYQKKYPKLMEAMGITVIEVTATERKKEYEKDLLKMNGYSPEK